MDALQSAVGEQFPQLARQLFGNVRLEFAEDSIDRRRLRSVMLGGCRVSELEAGTHSVFGDRVASASHDPDALKLLIQTRGSSLIQQSRRVIDFGDGTPVFCDPTKPYALESRLARSVPQSRQEPAVARGAVAPAASQPHRRAIDEYLEVIE
ncbi:hypothetical protein IHQ71_22865 [Rhizobium sp. TH2]|uniref:AraC-like ligand-binding domain-containing protein n=1 Tax=Rhizobium sp. TH2 TaxID=2775403 RepID=UPI0021578A62|nr:hypothetical protein [Rhizobium sp. TH2]UVC07985.1 hypothetical protein IHQ71_22865 [Rhizobium sp. TH2]